MNLKPQGKKYNRVAMVFHWLIAVLVLFQWGLGKYMGGLEEGSFTKFENFQLHKSIGITILILSLARLGWRLMNPVPPRPAGLKSWEELLRKFTHYGFYALLILIPLSGWATVSASPLNIPTELYGTVPWPHISWIAEAQDKEALEDLFHGIHAWLGWGMALLFFLHMAGIIKHTFILKDDLFKRMVPGK